MQTDIKHKTISMEVPRMKTLGSLIWFDTKKDYFGSHSLLHGLYMRLLSPTESILQIAKNTEAMKAFGGNDLYLGIEKNAESIVGLDINHNGYSIMKDDGKLEKLKRIEIEKRIEKCTLPELPVVYNYAGPGPMVLSIYKSRIDGRDLVIDGSHNPSKIASIVVGMWDIERMEKEGTRKEEILKDRARN